MKTKSRAGKAPAVALLIGLCILLPGCWDYRGLNEITIVSGVAIDKSAEQDYYRLTFETIDTSKSAGDEGIQSKLIEAYGETIFDAIRNAKRSIQSKLYFSNMQMVFICEEIAKTDGIYSVLDFFIRDAETRETTNIAISQEETARELFVKAGQEQGNLVISNSVELILDNDKKITASTKSMPIYKAYDELENQTNALVLPAVRLLEANEKTSAEINGVGIFDDDKLVGYLSADQSKYLMLMIGQMQGGIIPIADHGKETANISLEVAMSSTGRSYQLSGDRLTVTVEPELTVYLAEISERVDISDPKVIEEIAKMGEELIKKEMEGLIETMQTDYRLDIFGIGTMIYKKDPKTWHQISENWQDVFCNAEFNIKPKVNIINSANIT